MQISVEEQVEHPLEHLKSIKIKKLILIIITEIPQDPLLKVYPELNEVQLILFIKKLKIHTYI